MTVTVFRRTALLIYFICRVRRINVLIKLKLSKQIGSVHSCFFLPFQTVQKGAWAELEVVEKRIRQQETDVERMKDEYHREVMHLRNLVKQKESIISRLQQEKTYVRNSINLFMLPLFSSRLSGV